MLRKHLCRLLGSDGKGLPSPFEPLSTKAYGQILKCLSVPERPHQRFTQLLNNENLSHRRINRLSCEGCARPRDTVELGRARHLRWDVVDDSERCCYSALTIGGLDVASTGLCGSYVIK